MSYNVEIEKLIDTAVANWDLTEKMNMFGGICYLVNKHMCLGIYKDFLIVRAGEEIAEQKLSEPHVKPFDVTGRPMKGWVMLEEPIWKSKKSMAVWLDYGRTFALSLPLKN